MADGLTLAAAFGTVVREARKERGFSQEGFADHCGVHRTYMGLLERGRSNVTILTAQRVAKGLGLTMAELFGAVEAALERAPG
jgi:transcriptional regulator with XRE-family HTH domain